MISKYYSIENLTLYHILAAVQSLGKYILVKSFQQMICVCVVGVQCDESASISTCVVTN